jgi:hypothetical protein
LLIIHPNEESSKPSLGLPTLGSEFHKTLYILLDQICVLDARSSEDASVRLGVACPELLLSSGLSVLAGLLDSLLPSDVLNRSSILPFG